MISHRIEHTTVKVIWTISTHIVQQNNSSVRLPRFAVRQAYSLKNEVTMKTLLYEHFYWVSSKKMTGAVFTDLRGVITNTAPIFKVFRAQHINRLIRWLEKFGNVQVKEL